ncbi:ABC transporter permease [Ferrovibrio sp.]|uniref:ABC transporter permease n=1 Tax=Ferrovibrio sp. TaxID=1917215 RepID=UPI003D2A6B06
MTPRRGLFSTPLLVALAAPGAVVFAFFFLLPLVFVAGDAFVEGSAAFRRVFANPSFWSGLRGSVLLSLSAGVLSLGVGFAVALHLSRLSQSARTLLSFVIALPLTFSGMIVAYGFILAYGRAGFVTQLFGQIGFDPASIAGFLFSPYGLAFASSYYLIPRVVMLLLPVLVNFDDRQLAAAASLGARPWRALVDILLPQLFPSAAAAFCLVLAVVFGAYGTALALVGTQVNILPLQLYSLVSDTGADFPAAAALALLLTATCSGIMALGEWVAARHDQAANH